MPKIATFKLANAPEGEVLINERYLFKDGTHVRDEADGKLIEPILVGYYGCTLEWSDDTPLVESSDVDPPAPTLAKVETLKVKK